MGISIFKVRIENFRSIKNLELTLSMINVVIGANNCGKSNFLKAMNVALGQNRTISSDDIYVDKDEVLDNTKCATTEETIFIFRSLRAWLDFLTILRKMKMEYLF